MANGKQKKTRANEHANSKGNRKSSKGKGGACSERMYKSNNRGAASSDISNHGSSHYDDIKSNDIAWYNQAKFLYDEATRVPFDLIQGAPRSIKSGDFGVDIRGFIQADSLAWNGTNQVEAISTPGIMRVNFAPTIGWSDSINSPVNRAFTSIYGDIASKTTGAMQFTQSSLAMFTVSMCSIAALLGTAKRAIEVSFLYSPMNYYYPVDLLTSMFGSEDAAKDIIYNRDVYRAKVNDLIFQFNSFRIPHFVSIFQRQYSLCHNIYADKDDVRSEVTYFMPEGVYTYDDVNNKVDFTTVDWEDASLEYLLGFIEDSLNAWRHTSDLPLINGALQRAYPDSNFVKLDMLTPDSAMVPVFDRNMNWQINNMRTWNVIRSSLNITEDVVGDYLVCTPKAQVHTQSNFKQHWRNWVYLNSYDGDTSPEFIMEATRLIPTISPEVVDQTEGNMTVALNYVCSEIPHTFTIYNRERRYDSEADTYHSKLESYPLSTVVRLVDLESDRNSQRLLYGLSLLSQWHNAPRVDLITNCSYATGSIDVFSGTFGTTNVVTCLYPEQLVSLNEAALQSLYWTEDMNLRI